MVQFKSAYPRSCFRTKPSWQPTVTISSQNNPNERFTIHNSHLGPYPLFGFHINDLQKDLLPTGQIEYANGSKKIDGAILSQQISDLVEELYEKRKKVKRKKLKKFKILQDKNYSYKRACGLLVLKFKDYPFVLKLFIEKPKTLLNPYLTGLEQVAFFFMGNGASRHLSGLTRVQNLKRVNHQIAQLPRWADHVKTPRKWFWLPKQEDNIIIEGQNIGGKEYISTVLPSVYAIVADAMPIDQEIPIPTGKKKKMVMQLCNDLDVYVDPHFDNFIFLEDPIRKKFNIVIIDTEHFPTMVGLKHKKQFRNHSSWYMYLSMKCISDMFFQTKQDLINAQTYHRELMLSDPVRSNRTDCRL